MSNWTAAIEAKRWHNWTDTGVGCSLGCLTLATPAQRARRAQKFGVDRDDFLRLLDITEGRCMLCRLCHASLVDHCHDLGIVRGIVCRYCNNRLAFLEGGYPKRAPVYLRNYGCVCVDIPLMTDDERTRLALALENPTYAFIDHAADLWAGTVRDSFARLAANPYPDEDPQLPRLVTEVRDRLANSPTRPLRRAYAASAGPRTGE